MNPLLKLKFLLSAFLFLGVSYLAGAHAVEASPLPQGLTPTSVPPAGARFATVREINNQVVSRLTESQPEGSATVGQVIQVGGAVRTFAESKARVDLNEGTIVRLAPQTSFTVTQLNQNTADPFTRLRLLTGKLWIILNGGSLDVETPVGVASVRGSYMSVNFNPATGLATITCLEGTCAIEVGGVIVVMHDNQQVTTNTLTIIKIDDKELLDWSANNPESNKFMPPQSGLNDLQFDNGTPLVPCANTTGSFRSAGWRVFAARPLSMCAAAE
jgi:hypothetical protein